MTGVRIITVGIAEIAGRDDTAGLVVARALRADGVPVTSRAVVDEDEAALEAALGPALQSVGVSQGYYLFNAAPYVLTLLIMVITCSPKRTLVGAPAELSITK